MSFDDLFRQNILDHYQSPRNFGTLEHPDISAEDSNPLCGDVIRMDLKIEDGKVADVRFSGKGCSISRAAASMLTEEIRGKSLEEVKRIGKDEVLEMLGIELGPVRLKCALLALKTLKVGVYGIRGWPGEDGGTD
ncbi:MAG: SUF system NifU family Fe-S cluster assembly protein [Candidatus Eisenbacteria bacterium]|jgi:nitrogen fixation protein NifU and related proteins|uniref:SUF system NifU family Fe-S cluster assembly protein n=1 Tax=Eiseniibacteriota bacterium TaxID=2212470 RepID=A0A538TUS9_UNCEI|nr:MAG: SUF system NifU family Fe-S cluster assembly protein [Candidatus Eisenbacteria bacterium]